MIHNSVLDSTLNMIGEPADLLEDLPNMNQGQLLDRYREVIDDLDTVFEMEARAKEIRGLLQNRLLELSESEGVERFMSDRISITVKEKTVARVEPERWEEVKKELVNSGHGDVLYRQVSASKLQELFDGGMALPKGVTLDEVKVVNHRRR